MRKPAQSKGEMSTYFVRASAARRQTASLPALASFARLAALILKSDDLATKKLLEGFEMKLSLSEEALRGASERLASSNQQFVARYPGESGRRQPVHTVYGGAQLFRADLAQRLGQVAQRALAENAPDFVVFARAIGLPWSSELPDVLEYATGLRQRLENEPDAVRE